MLSHIHLSDTEIKQVNQILEEFIGLPLTDVWGNQYSLSFEFGEQHYFVNARGSDSRISHIGIHAHGSGEITGPDEVHYSIDGFFDGLEIPKEFYDLIDSGKLVLVSASVDVNGSLRLVLTGGYEVAIRRVDSAKVGEDAPDTWRINGPCNGCFLFGDVLRVDEPGSRIQIFNSEEDTSKVKTILAELINLNLTEFSRCKSKHIFEFTHLQGKKVTVTASYIDARVFRGRENPRRVFRHPAIQSRFENEITQGKIFATNVRLDREGSLAIDLNRRYRIVIRDRRKVGDDVWSVQLSDSRVVNSKQGFQISNLSNQGD